MKKIFSLFIISILLNSSFGQINQTEDSISLLFIGDIMGHGPQIKAAYNSKTKKYDYSPVFNKLKPVFESVDFAIANLEVTLAGKPFKGYPQFSSPDNLAESCKNSGIDVLVTANNHSCDRGKKGILRTLKILDKIGIRHTGTFRDKKERDTSNLLILKKGNIKIGILNYTYGTNGLPFPSPTIVNIIDQEKMALDIKQSKNKNLDKLIVFVHWGKEYESLPNKEQMNTADFLFKQGVDIIIGSHPHVLQPMIYTPQTGKTKEKFIAYSLGNFVSNQRTRKRDGGTMIQLVIKKTKERTYISNKGYILTWVNKTKNGKKNKYEVLTCKNYTEIENRITSSANSKMKIFTGDSRKLLTKENKNVSEITSLLTQKESLTQVFRFSERGSIGTSIHLLDKVFNTQKELYNKSYSKMVEEFNSFLSLNNFVWEKKVWGFNRIYFKKDGTIKYIIYSIYENQISEKREKEYKMLLTKFAETYTFPIKAENNFSYYSPIYYSPNKK